MAKKWKNIRLDEETYKRLKKLAKIRKWTLSTLISELINPEKYGQKI